MAAVPYVRPTACPLPKIQECRSSATCWQSCHLLSTTHVAPEPCVTKSS